MATERIGKAILELVTDATGFFAGLDAATKKTQIFGQDITKVSAGLRSFGQSATALGQGLTVGLTAPIVGIGAGAIKLATDFESSFAGIRKTVGDATDALGNLTPVGEALAQGMRNLSKEIPVNVNELNRIGEAAGQLGIQSDNILDFTRVMANLGATTNLSSDQAATSLARLANITQMPQDQFDRLGSTIVALGNNFATTEAEIVEMGLRLAGAGNQIGLSEGQILGMATALSSVGINAEAGGTAFSKVMINMASAVSGGGKALQEFADVAGVSTGAFAEQFRTDAAGAVNAFVRGLGNLKSSGGDVLGTLEAMGISEVRMRDALLRASGAGDLLTQALNLQATAWEENTALTKEAEQRYRTFDSQLTLTWNLLKDVGITIGTALLPVFRDLLTSAQPLIAWAADAAQMFGALPGPVKTFAVVLAGLAAAIGPVLIAAGAMASGIAAILPILAPVGAALSGIALGPIALIGGAIAGLVLIWMKWGDDITRITRETIQSVKQWLVDFWEGSIFQSVAQLLRAFVELWIAIFAQTVQEVAAFIGLVQEWLVTKLQPVIDAIRPVLTLMQTIWTTAKDAVIGIVTALYNGVKSWLLDKFTAIVDGIKAKIDAVTGFFKGMKDAVVGNSHVPEMIDGIIAQFLRLDEGMVKPVVDATGFISQQFEKLTAFALEQAGSLFDGLQSKTSGLFGGKAGGLFGSLISSGMSAVFGPGGIALNLLSQGMSKLGEIALKGLKKIGAFFKNLFGGPSAEELAGREIVAHFETNIRSMLTDQQRLETGNEGWKQTIVAVRDAYIAVGLSEQDALTDVDRLWASSRDGGEDSQAVVEEITRKMEGFGAATQQAFKAFPKELRVAVEFDVGELRLPSVRGLEIPVIPQAAGGMGLVTQPTLFLAGEAGPEEFAFSGAGRRFTPGRGGETVVHTHVMLDGREVGRSVERFLMGNLRQQSRFQTVTT